MKTNLMKKTPSMTDGVKSLPIFLKAEDGYEAYVDAYRVLVAKPETGAAVTLCGDGISVGWRWLGEKKPDRLTICGKSAVYEGILPDVDLEYRVEERGIKENLILNRPSNCDRFAFALSTGGLVPHEDADGGLSLCDGNIAVLRIPAPFMFDADGNRSDDVRYDLVAEGDGYRLTLLPNPKWLADPARVYPVTVDPQLVLPKIAEQWLNLTYTVEKCTRVDFDQGNDSWQVLSDYPDLSVKIDGMECYRTMLTITKTGLPRLYPNIKDAWLCFVRHQREAGKMLSGADFESLSNWPLNDEPVFKLPLKDFSYMSGSTINMAMSPSPDNEGDYYFECFMHGEYAPYVEIVWEEEASDGKRLTIEELPSVERTAATLNVPRGVLGFEISDVFENGSPLNHPISHVFNSSVGKTPYGFNFCLNLDESLVKSNKENSKVDYVYTDASGEKYGFTERFYYLNNGKKEYLSEEEIEESTPNADGSLKMKSGREAMRELYSASGWQATTLLEGLKNIDFFEQRSEERAQLENQLKS